MAKQTPTARELEILSVLWQFEDAQGSVRQVHGVLGKLSNTGYTTTLKFMQNMAQKGFLNRDCTHRTHIYTPAIKQENTQTQMVSGMIDKLFNGSAQNLIMHLLQKHTLSSDDQNEINAMLNHVKDIKLGDKP